MNMNARAKFMTPLEIQFDHFSAEAQKIIEEFRQEVAINRNAFVAGGVLNYSMAYGFFRGKNLSLTESWNAAMFCSKQNFFPLHYR